MWNSSQVISVPYTSGAPWVRYAAAFKESVELTLSQCFRASSSSQCKPVTPYLPSRCLAFSKPAIRPKIHPRYECAGDWRSYRSPIQLGCLLALEASVNGCCAIGGCVLPSATAGYNLVHLTVANDPAGRALRRGGMPWMRIWCNCLARFR